MITGCKLILKMLGVAGIALMTVALLNAAIDADNQRFAKENADYLQRVEEMQRLSSSKTSHVSITTEDEVNVYHYESNDVYEK